ncbi:MAG: SGNH/GDSL hydrolase family protein [Salinimicrobium sp.]
MKNLSIIVFIFFVFISCNDSSEKSLPEDNEIPVEAPLTYLALGDSYTIGESVTEEARWPMQLVDSLRKKGVLIEKPKIIAKTGWTTADLLDGMDTQLHKNEQYDLVSILIGVNNQYQGSAREEYEHELEEIFTRAISRSKTGASGVFAVSIPDYGATPFGASKFEEIAKEIEEFNTVFKRITEVHEVAFYNITPISKRAENDPDLVANDGLHPSGKMYSLWVSEFLDELAEKLTSKI